MRALLSTPRLRSKLSFTVLAVLLYRIGQNLPSPGVDVPTLRDAVAAAVRGYPVYGLLDLLTGGGLLHLAVLGLDVFPQSPRPSRCRSSPATVPRLRTLAAEAEGAARIGRVVAVLAVALGAVMATAVAFAATAGRLPGGAVLTSTTNCSRHWIRTNGTSSSSCSPAWWTTTPAPHRCQASDHACGLR